LDGVVYDAAKIAKQFGHAGLLVRLSGVVRGPFLAVGDRFGDRSAGRKAFALNRVFDRMNVLAGRLAQFKVWAGTGRRAVHARVHNVGPCARRGRNQPQVPKGGERLGYQTQKPLKLLRRIIEASSNPGDIVLDPFCGCGTALYAAQELKRQWVGIDITHLAIGLIERHLKGAFPGISFMVEGTPPDIDGARDLAMRDKYQFQHWATSLVGAQSYKNKKKGSDGGIDGLIFPEEGPGKHSKIIVSVKGGDTVGDAMLKDLIATVEHEKAQMGLFVTLARPTKPMKARAAAAGYYTAQNGVEYPRIQILPIEDLLSGKVRPEYFNSSGGSAGFKRTKPQLKDSHHKQGSLLYPEGSPELDDDFEDDDDE